MIGETARDGNDRVDDRSQLCRNLTAACEPFRLQAQQITDINDTGAAKPRCLFDGARVSRDAINVAGFQSRIPDRLQGRDRGQLPRVYPEAPSNLRSADPADNGFLFDRGHGANNGI